MSDTINQMTNNAFRNYWSSMVTGLTTLITEHELALSKIDKSNAAGWKQAAIDFHEKATNAYKQHSKEAVKLAERIESGAIKGTDAMKAKLHGTAAFFDKVASQSVDKCFSALDKEKASKLLSTSRSVLAKASGSIGLVADAINIGIKYQEGDIHGAIASGIGTATVILATAVLSLTGGIALIPTVLLMTGLSIIVPEAAEFMLDYFNPFGINKKTNADFQSAQNFVQYVDPLVLDLDGDGIETVSANSGITFDFNDDGLKTGTGWLSGDDGFLVLDRNGNGTIDNGSELFGVDTIKSDGTLAKDGFDALRDLDSNGDGLFDAYDLLFEQMRAWQDKNQDGISQADELKSLNELGISAIHLDNSSSNRLDNGNRISATGTTEFADGLTGTVANIDLASNPFYREFLDKLPISKSIKGLPDMHGSGAVRDLQEAASQSKELANLLKQYSRLPTRKKQRAYWIDGYFSNSHVSDSRNSFSIGIAIK